MSLSKDKGMPQTTIWIAEIFYQKGLSFVRLDLQTILAA